MFDRQAVSRQSRGCSGTFAHPRCSNVPSFLVDTARSDEPSLLEDGLGLEGPASGALGDDTGEAGAVDRVAAFAAPCAAGSKTGVDADDVRDSVCSLRRRSAIGDKVAGSRPVARPSPDDARGRRSMPVRRSGRTRVESEIRGRAADDA